MGSAARAANENTGRLSAVWEKGTGGVYLPDLKYGLSEPARKYSGAADYFDWAKRAILEMFRQTGPYRMENGLLKQGVLIRHLLLPGELERHPKSHHRLGGGELPP